MFYYLTILGDNRNLFYGLCFCSMSVNSLCIEFKADIYYATDTESPNQGSGEPLRPPCVP